MNSPTDDLLMLQVRRGDSRQLGILFERYQGALFNFYVRMTGDRDISEDLVQDVFFRMLKYRHTYRAGNQFTTWMYQIARNAWFDHIGKRKREVALDEERDETVGPEPLPGEQLEKKQEVALLRHALVKLPHEKREVLVLSRFQNLKYEQIAELLGCDVGTVKVRVYRALQDLREIFFKLSGRKAS